MAYAADPNYDPHEPLPGPPVAVIGCGNLLRGDDAAGPVVIRELWQRGVGDLVRLVDGGTAGMDVAFQMRGAEQVILIDAADSGSEPGTLFRVPGEAIAEIPPPTDLHSHSFRWDHALSFAKWLLKEQYPRDIEVWLIEAGDTTHGADLTEPVRRAVVELADRLAARFRDDAIAAPTAMLDQGAG